MMTTVGLMRKIMRRMGETSCCVMILWREIVRGAVRRFGTLDLVVSEVGGSIGN